MWPDWVSNPGPLTYESGTLPTALRGSAPDIGNLSMKYFMLGKVYTDEGGIK